MAQIKSLTRSIMGSFTQPLIELTEPKVTRLDRVNPLIQPVSEIMEEAYHCLTPCYVDGVETEEAELVEIKYSDAVEDNVGIYKIRTYSGPDQYFVWYWHDEGMHELEQRNVPEGGRRVAMRAMRSENRWLYN